MLAAEIDWAGFVAGLDSARPHRVLAELIELPADGGEPAGAPCRHRLDGVPRAGRRRVLLDLVRGEVARLLGYAGPSAVDPERGLVELGLDSLAALRLRQTLGTGIGLRLPATLIFDQPAANALTGYLAEQLRSAESAATESTKPAQDEVLAQLDRLERLLAARVLDAGVGAQVATRLRALTTTVVGAAPDVYGTSDEELVGMLEEEFGIS